MTGSAWYLPCLCAAMLFLVQYPCDCYLVPVQMEGVRKDGSGVASAVPQVIRRQSRGSQALQLARSLGSAGVLSVGLSSFVGETSISLQNHLFAAFKAMLSTLHNCQHELECHQNSPSMHLQRDSLAMQGKDVCSQACGSWEA